jgi:hypothetical protein
MIGVKPETKNMVLVLMGSEKSRLIATLNKIVQFVKGEVDDTIVTSTDKAKLEKLRNIYKITPLEINSKIYNAQEVIALEELIIERVAMLGIKHD